MLGKRFAKYFVKESINTHRNIRNKMAVIIGGLDLMPVLEGDKLPIHNIYSLVRLRAI